MAKIRVAILDADQIYLSRLAASLQSKFPDKTELYSFTDPERALAHLSESKIDVFLANEQFPLEDVPLPKHCTLARLSETNRVAEAGETPILPKYQKVELIYKEILSIYAENAGAIRAGLGGESNTLLVTFSSPCGGCGSSTVAAACALNLTQLGCRVLYLDLQMLSDISVFFQGEGRGSLSDVLYAIKRKRTNLPLKLESTVKQSSEGVYFYDMCVNPLEYGEFSGENIKELLTALVSGGEYSHIILDTSFRLVGSGLATFGMSDVVVVTSDGSELANVKLARAILAMEILEKQGNPPLLPRIKLFYNRFSTEHGTHYPDDTIPVLGGAPRFQGAPASKIVRELATRNLFRELKGDA